MARPLHRGGRLAESSRGHEEDDRLDSNQKGRDSILSPHSLGLWMKQTNLAPSPPLLSKSSSSRISHKFSENGLKSGPKDLGPPFIDLDSSMGPANNVGRGRQGTAPTFFKCTALCFVSLFILIAVIGTAKPWTTSSRPTHNIYRGYRRLREQVMADFSDIGVISLGLSRPKELSFCSREVEDFIPCYNVSENQLRGYTNEEEYDRHCGFARIMEPCLVHPPKDYKIPLRWPTGRDVIWSGNVKITKEQLLSSGSLTKRLMLLEDSQISFRSEDALVVDGVEDYSHQIAEMIGLHNESDFIQAGVHTVLDIGCGFGSFGAHLFSKKLLTMCIATYEVYGSQVQLALERGLPAMVGSFVSRQLPYPSLSFDMVHCARCGIDWDQKDGAFLIEIDRVLKPGGYFVWTSPLTDLRGAMLTSGNQNKWKFIRDFTQKICWDLLSQQEETVVWQKTSSKDCYTYRKLGAVPPVCNKGQDIESPYYQPLLSCIAGTHSHRWIPIQNQTSWPARMTPSSDVLSIHGIQAEDFTEDSHAWTSTLKNYWSLLTPLIFSDHPKRPGEEDPLPPFNMLRNIMDMNARYGGLNAALLEARKTVWVMNVIPTSGSNTLPLILDRGFVGVLHDWCEAFPTYPRTYDMLHAAGLLSQELNHQYKCGMVDLFLEMDRILRPEGWVVLRDEIQKIEEARTITVQMRWDARVVELEGDNEQRLLVCQKPFLKK